MSLDWQTRRNETEAGTHCNKRNKQRNLRIPLTRAAPDPRSREFIGNQDSHRMSFISSSTSSLLDKRPHLPLPNEHDRHPKSSSNSSRRTAKWSRNFPSNCVFRLSQFGSLVSSLTFPCAAFYDGAIAGHAPRLERTSRNGLKLGAEALPGRWCRVIEESCGKVAPARKFGTAVTPAVTLTSFSSAAIRLMSLILLVPLPRLERGTPRSTIWCSNQLSYSGERGA
jgi:hypothetical protein